MAHQSSLSQLVRTLVRAIKSAGLGQSVYNPSRRQFLIGSVSATAFAAAPTILKSHKGLQFHQQKVSIIGAGIAGLTAAYELKKLGYSCTVYEGLARIGGRIQTVYNQFNTKTYSENGGEFVNSGHSTIRRLCHERAIPLIDLQADSKTGNLDPLDYYINGERYTESEILLAFTEASKIVARDLNSCGDSYDTPTCKNLDNTSLEEYVNSLPMPAWLKDLLRSAYEAEYGLPGGEQSALNLIDMISSGLDKFEIYGKSDQRYKIHGGSQKLVDSLKAIIDPEIVTNKKLISLRSTISSVELSFSDGTNSDCDYVILAIPFTALRDVKLEIDGITEVKKRCISELGYGKNCKLILSAATRGWRKDGSSGYLINETIQNGWDGTQGQANNQGPGSYTVFLGAPASTGVNSGELEAIDKCLRLSIDILKEVYPSTAGTFTGNHRLAVWTDKPLSQGSYPCYKVGQWTTLSGHEATPVGRVHFAGDHTSDEFQGYMNGAAESGVRVANEVAIKLKSASA